MRNEKLQIENLAKTLTQKLEKNYLVFVAKTNEKGLQVFYQIDELSKLYDLLKDLNENELEAIDGILVSVNPVLNQTERHKETNCDIKHKDFVFAYDIDMLATKNFVSRLIDNAKRDQRIKHFELWISASGKLHVYAKLYKTVYAQYMNDLQALKDFKVEFFKDLVFGTENEAEFDLTGKFDKMKELQWLVWLEGIPHRVKNFNRSIKLYELDNVTGKELLNREAYNRLPNSWKYTIRLQRNEFENFNQEVKELAKFLCQKHGIKLSSNEEPKVKTVKQSTNASQYRQALPTEAWNLFSTRLEALKRHPSKTYKKFAVLWLLESFINYHEGKFSWKKPDEGSARFRTHILPAVAILRYLIKEAKAILGNDFDKQIEDHYESRLQSILYDAFPDKVRDIDIAFKVAYANEKYLMYRFTKLTNQLAMALNSRLEIAKILEVWDLLDNTTKQKLLNGDGLDWQTAKELAEQLSKRTETVYNFMQNFKTKFYKALNWVAKKATGLVKSFISKYIDSQMHLLNQAAELVDRLNKLFSSAQMKGDKLFIQINEKFLTNLDRFAYEIAIHAKLAVGDFSKLLANNSSRELLERVIFVGHMTKKQVSLYQVLHRASSLNLDLFA